MKEEDEKRSKHRARETGPDDDGMKAILEIGAKGMLPVRALCDQKF